ncbi:hypothetical protein CRENPOLYSF2_2140002 [Crenothrix polyspora]|uniref:Uncharacterized protein n=1 Tax=Crenothrix polyspora TaxID=360316 RepID=A0A1R4H4T2_9GAMM|nr:hypothetical protein CRENPOLYSF2_2140002 [Crenothrix polyspora]
MLMYNWPESSSTMPQGVCRPFLAKSWSHALLLPRLKPPLESSPKLTVALQSMLILATWPFWALASRSFF